MWLPRLFGQDEDGPSSKMGTEFALNEEVIRRLVERIIKLEVQHETLKRRVEEPFMGNDGFGPDECGENNRLVLWNRIIRLEEGQRVTQTHVQELFANVMDFELQSRGEPCHLHELGSDFEVKSKAKDKWKGLFGKSARSSTIMGIKYLTSSNSLIQRVFWAVVLAVSVSLCALTLYLSYSQWGGAPAEVTVGAPTPLATIPFPAVTVCPQRDISALYPLDSLITRCNATRCSSDQMDLVSAAALLCPSLLQNIPIGAWTPRLNTSSPSLIEQLLPSCAEDVSLFHWPEGSHENCTRGFQTLVVDGQVCHSYNLLPAADIFRPNVVFRPAVRDSTGLAGRSDWTPDFQNCPDPKPREAPVHVDAAGEETRLTVELRRKPHGHQLCTDRFDTYQVVVHSPGDLPSRSGHRYLRLPVGHTMLLSVTPLLSRASSPCRDPALTLFAHYSQTNCLLECRTLCSISLCGCVPLHLPRVNNDTKWCGLSRRYCPDTLVPELMKGKLSWEAIAKHFQREINEDLRDQIASRVAYSDGDEGWRSVGELAPLCSCACPPPCTTLEYQLDTQVIPFNLGQDRSGISIYFQEGQDFFTTTQKRTIFSLIDFLAHCGGLIALFLGVSLVSVVELVYLMAPFCAGRHDAQLQEEIGECQRRREWHKTAQTDPIFISDCSVSIKLSPSE